MCSYLHVLSDNNSHSYCMSDPGKCLGSLILVFVENLKKKEKKYSLRNVIWNLNHTGDILYEQLCYSYIVNITYIMDRHSLGSDMILWRNPVSSLSTNIQSRSLNKY